MGWVAQNGLRGSSNSQLTLTPSDRYIHSRQKPATQNATQSGKVIKKTESKNEMEFFVKTWEEWK